jgi:hypothetical protein
MGSVAFHAQVACSRQVRVMLSPALLPVALQRPGPSLHRIGTVRRLERISRSRVARNLDCEVAQIKYQEQPTSDILLSQLYAWQKVLEVPAVELLVEPSDSLAPYVSERAQMTRLMKTVALILEMVQQESIRKMAQDISSRLVNMMPELQHVRHWNTVGERRRRDDLGVAAERSFSGDILTDPSLLDSIDYR